MIQIRSGVFETNSSSVHALVIGNHNDKLETNRIVNFGLWDFGWEDFVLSDVDELASYLYTACCSYYEKDMQSEIRELLPPEVDARFAVPKFEVFEYDGQKHYYLSNGSVDHVEELKPWLEKILSDKELLARFLFSRSSYIVLTNDNSGYNALPKEGMSDNGDWCFIKRN